MTTLYVEVLLFFAGIIALMWMFHGPHRRLALDETRSRLFEIREALWEQANQGLFDRGQPLVSDSSEEGRPAGFDDDAYVLARRSINATITKLDRLTFWSLVVLMAGRPERSAGREFKERFEAALKKHDATAQKELLRALMAYHFAIVGMIIRRSMILLSIAQVLKFVAEFLRQSNRLKEAVSSSRYLWKFDGAITTNEQANSRGKSAHGKEGLAI